MYKLEVIRHQMIWEDKHIDELETVGEDADEVQF
jgi:hypothetical protein